ncbi:MAG: lipoyl(octanoyl) transferase LipB [Candidatus Omnitrophica bacterium]|jgi:lipoate-protein ligase B|nr:lipoyl(octanoyl) transferase LipB [Candidatus Omnitrophota bacterium]
MVFKLFNLGIMDYKEAWELQGKVFGQIKNNSLNSALILCQHYPVITLGRQGKEDNIRVLPLELKRMGIGVYKIERGGDVTYHGPGQLIAYPVLDLGSFKKDIHLFLRQLEESAIKFLSAFGVKGLRRKGLTGVWIGQRKIASIGIAIKNWITFHGISINLKKNDLDNFNLIRPCGMDIEMTSLETILGENIEIGRAKEIFIDKFKDEFLIPN